MEMVEKESRLVLTGGVIGILIPLGRVGFDIEPGQFEVLLVADDMFVIVALPTFRYRPAFQRIDFFRRLIFEIRNDLSQRPFL